MDLLHRFEMAMSRALQRDGQAGPERLRLAMSYAVLPGGARIRPTILMSVALACGDDLPEMTDSAAVALELIHCASLVHDDLPAFDNADLRRGKPSVHKQFSEPLAVLAGDALIVKAFEIIATASRDAPERGLALTAQLALRTGAPHGICAGQGWESEPRIDLAAYHRAKTAALFCAATQMGAISAGQDPDQWFDLGNCIGEAFQVADDIRDAMCTSEEMGKPSGQDGLHGRPSAVSEFGLDGALQRLDDILAGAISTIPRCPGEEALARMVRRYADMIVPKVVPSRPPLAGE